MVELHGSLLHGEYIVHLTVTPGPGEFVFDTSSFTSPPLGSLLLGTIRVELSEVQLIQLYKYALFQQNPGIDVIGRLINRAFQYMMKNPDRARDILPFDLTHPTYQMDGNVQDLEKWFIEIDRATESDVFPSLVRGLHELVKKLMAV